MDRFREFELSIARIGLLAIVVIILAGGVGRATGHPIIWSLEIAMMLFAWVSMFAIDYAFQTRRHIGIDAVVNLLPVKIQRACLWINELLILAFLLCGVWYGFKFTWTTQHQVLPVTELSLAWLNSAVPTGCLLMVLTSLSWLLKRGRGKENTQSREDVC
ncbi:TRAP transporter small permease [Pseudocitrobacter cyperus]|uniref:TRAP transporter small permease protein n=1 Tax=Pseudocitrobacter cyperus TaxID=3112843 RepID=A0ABV0HGS3_9ENTR